MSISQNNTNAPLTAQGNHNTLAVAITPHNTITIAGHVNGNITLEPQSTVAFTENGSIVDESGAFPNLAGQSITNTFTAPMHLSADNGFLTLTPIATDLAGNNVDPTYLEGQ